MLAKDDENQISQKSKHAHKVEFSLHFNLLSLSKGWRGLSKKRNVAFELVKSNRWSGSKVLAAGNLKLLCVCLFVCVHVRMCVFVCVCVCGWIT